MDFDISLERMEQLEKKYGVELHVNQYEDKSKPDEYFIVETEFSFPYLNERLTFEYLGSTLDEVERRLEEKYGNKDI